MSTQNQTIGQEVIRVQFAATGVVAETKQKFADLYDYLTEFVLKAEKEINTPPAVYSQDSINNHMEVIRKNEELMRCVSEAAKLIETAAMFAVKGLTA